MEESSKLFVVPTPIGNLSDITFRAIEVLKSVDTILAEDTRTSGKLLKHYSIGTRTESFHAFNEHKRIDRLIDRIKNGEQVAIISDAGTPGISDPGFLLTRAAIEASIDVECLPGASAFIPALVKSGMPMDKFVFEGFLPHKKGRQTRLKFLALETRTIVVYESPHRLIKLFDQMLPHFSEDRPVSVSRELTKKFEETITGTLRFVKDHFDNNPPRGEFVVIIGGLKE